MKVSVVIPVYNVENYLEQCIESVLMQTYKNIEILLINDGSTDNSKKICEEYQSKYPYIILVNKINGGLSSARNTGIKKASGEYIVFLDSDDYWSNDFLKDLINIINEKKGLDYIFFRHTTYRQKSNYFEEDKLNINRESIEFENGVNALTYILRKNNDFHWSACTGLIRKEFIIENELFFEEGRNYEDALWTPNVFLNAKKLDYYDHAVYIYRLEREGQITSDITYKNLKDSIYVAKSWDAKLRKIKINEEAKQAILKNTSTRYFYAIWFSGFLNKKERKKIIKLLKENKKLLFYNHSFITKCTYFLSKIIGFRLTSFFFKLVITIKRTLK